MSCLLITLNKCVKGHKYLGLLLGSVLKMSLSLSLSLYLSLSNLFWSWHGFSSLWTNVSKVTSLWGHSVVMWRLWLLVVPDRPSKGQGHLLSCSGQLKDITISTLAVVQIVRAHNTLVQNVWYRSLHCLEIPMLSHPLLCEMKTEVSYWFYENILFFYSITNVQHELRKHLFLVQVLYIINVWIDHIVGIEVL